MSVALKSVGDSMAITMSGIIDKRKSANTFLFDLLYGRSKWKFSETGYFQYDVTSGAVQMAEMTDENGHAQELDRRNADTQSGYVPMLASSFPLSMSPDMFLRRPGELKAALTAEGKSGTALKNFIAQMEEDMEEMLKAHDARKEWLAAQALSGTIVYQNEQGNDFTYDYNKPAGNTVSAVATWDSGSARPQYDMNIILSSMADVDGMVGIGLVNAATANKIWQNVEAGYIKPDSDKGLNLGRNNPWLAQFSGLETDYRTRRMFSINGVELFMYGGKDPQTSAVYIPNDVIRLVDLDSSTRDIMWAPILGNVTRRVNGQSVKLPDYIKTRTLAYSESINEPPSIKQFMKQRYLPVEKRADRIFDLTVY